MKQEIKETLAIPEGVHVTKDHDVFTVKGPKGELKKELKCPGISLKVQGREVEFHVKVATMREKKMVMTFKSLLKSAFKGVAEGHTYRLKICASHFPMTASVKGNVLEVKNFFGEQTPRTVTIVDGAKVKVNGQEIVVEGIDKSIVSQAAAKFEEATKRPGFDKRRFQDGIYLIEKDGKVLHQG